LSIPEKDLSRAAQLRHLGEDHLNRLLHATVGIELDPTTGRPAQPDREQDSQFTATGFLSNGFQRSLAQQIQFEFTHGAFQAQEQPVVDETGIVDAIGIDDDGADHATQFDQVVPIAAVPCQARRFDTEHGAHLSRTDVRDESLESRALHQTRPRPPQILVDDHDVLEAELAGVLGQAVLAALTFLVVDNLARRGLTHVHQATPPQTVSGQLRIHHRLRP
jgi:hypothetical protein